MVDDEEVIDTFNEVDCGKCQDGFAVGMEMLNYNGLYYHTECFVCEQCFR